jgi:sarcosine oxidase, subunit alpha
MLQRTRALRDPVTVFLDGSPIDAERGEPLAVALLAADKITLARSPKLHRPRGPSCLRGACDGCLARVGGVPNIMTCLRVAEDGERIETQNVVGSRSADLLRVTDWFFPNGLDHHHLMAGVPGLGDVMQGFARKLAGMGRIPAQVEAVRPARRLAVDAAVVGAGLSGLCIASTLSSRGASVCLIDDGLDLGGSLSAAPALRSDWLRAYPLRNTEVLGRSTAAGMYLGEMLVASEIGATVVRARATIFATGAHDGTLAAAGNDLPGVFSARALCRLLALGVRPTGTTLVAGSGFWADQVLGELGEAAIRVDAAQVIAIRGTGRVKRAVIRQGDGTQTLKIDAVAVAIPPAPAFELPAQAGATVRYDPENGYAVVGDDRGRAAEGVWACGECTGMPFVPEALVSAALRVAADVGDALALA